MPYLDKNGRTCGFLNIEESENSGSFIRRYFLLDSNNERLLYFMDNPNNLPPAWRNSVGEINLQYVSKVSDGKKLRPKVNNCFVINVAGRRYFLEAESDEDKVCWIDALNNASKIRVPEDNSLKQTTEWRPQNLNQQSYVTEIAGGVVCKMPVQLGEEDSGESSSDDEESTSRSSSSGRVSPSNSLSRSLSEAPRVPSSPGGMRVYKGGYGVKQGAVRKSWKRRYFTLHEGGFSYFRTEHEKSPIRTIPLSDILEARPSTGAQMNRDNLFELMTSKRIFYIQCDTPEEMLSWIEAIKTLLRNRKAEERKSMQDPDSHRAFEEELCDKSYPKEVWLRDRLGDVSGRGRLRKKTWMFW